MFDTGLEPFFGFDRGISVAAQEVLVYEKHCTDLAAMMPISLWPQRDIYLPPVVKSNM